MNNQKTLDNIANSFINASKQGYEWRTIETSEGIEHFFYNPKEDFYDKNLKKIVDETSKLLGFRDFLKYSVCNPIKGIKLISSMYKIRKTVREKE